MVLVSFSHGYCRSFHHQHHVKSGTYGSREEAEFLSETLHVDLAEHKKNDPTVEGMVALEDKFYDGNSDHRCIECCLLSVQNNCQMNCLSHNAAFEADLCTWRDNVLIWKMMGRFLEQLTGEPKVVLDHLVNSAKNYQK